MRAPGTQESPDGLSRSSATLRVARDARRRFGLGAAAGAPALDPADLRSARLFAQRMNEARGPAAHNGGAVRASDLHAAAVLHGLLRAALLRYERVASPGVLRRLWAHLVRELGEAPVREALQRFLGEYPLVAGDEEERDESEAIFDLILVMVAARNPALRPLHELFDDSPLQRDRIYARIVDSASRFLEREPQFEPEARPLVQALEAPMRANPDSLAGQIGFIRQRWQSLLDAAPGAPTPRQVALSLDAMREEDSPRGASDGPGPVYVPSFGPPPPPPLERLARRVRPARRGALRVAEAGPAAGAGRMPVLARSAEPAAPAPPMALHPRIYPPRDVNRLVPPEVVTEFEINAAPQPRRYSGDEDWMPRVVLQAKNAYVWLAQLAARHGREIQRLDQIPDEALDRLAAWGINALWLIGVWERSPASQTIKRRYGVADALASAYSIADYAIAADLGGDAAWESLRERAWSRGIRMALDLVPNHTGVVSRWMREHPDWFLQLPEPPYPTYKFTGPDLSEDPAYAVHIEDGYWTRTDAAVVFRRTDRGTGEERFIYHGNDGTGTPWNDTAQLDFMNPEVREAVTGSILDAARLAPILRFDAAMVLSRRHWQRLWFPKPGEGGDIPTRSEHALTQGEFDARMPGEFWREVVLRVAQKAPGTLLLAEAFWLMESYFVRTLGMHRVYQSAFMNMLKGERNGGYRQLLRNVLAFDPAILERFVNFMNNPDEAPAETQFGRGDRYFGVATMMVTLPGLPMFGHGQIEGLREKYGMEFGRPRLTESPDAALIARHERQIVPLLARRDLFAGSSHFALYEVVDLSGRVNENVLAYSNRSGAGRALVLCNNSGRRASGWIRRAIPTADTQGLTLVSALGLSREDGPVAVFRDAVGGRSVTKTFDELDRAGFRVELGPYQTQVFPDVTPVRELEGGLNMRDTASTMDLPAAAWDDTPVAQRLEEAIEKFHGTLGPELLGSFTALWAARTDTGTAATKARAEFAEAFAQAVTGLAAAVGAPRAAAAAEARRRLAGAFALSAVDTARPGEVVAGDAGARFETILFAYLIAKCLTAPRGGASSGAQSVESALADWVLEKGFTQAFGRMGCDGWMARRRLLLVKALAERASEWPAAAGETARTAPLLEDTLLREYLLRNWHQGVEWFHQESWEDLVFWFAVARVVEGAPREAVAIAADALRDLGRESGFRMDTLLESLKSAPAPAAAPYGAPMSEPPAAPPATPAARAARAPRAAAAKKTANGVSAPKASAEPAAGAAPARKRAPARRKKSD